jgi:DNA-binding PadR family transcriptional regulator
MVELIASASPLSPVVLAILLSLAAEEKHGYAIMKDTQTPAGGNVRMGPGTLYGSLDRMIRDRLVKESPTSDDERRRYYRLTALGRTVLETEIKRLDAAVNSARSMGLIGNRGRS